MKISNDQKYQMTKVEFDKEQAKIVTTSLKKEKEARNKRYYSNLGKSSKTSKQTNKKEIM